MAVTAADVQRVLRKYVLDAKQVTIEYAQDDDSEGEGQVDDGAWRVRRSARRPRARSRSRSTRRRRRGPPRPARHCRAGRRDARQRPARRGRAAARAAARHRRSSSFARASETDPARARGACRHHRDAPHQGHREAHRAADRGSRRSARRHARQRRGLVSLERGDDGDAAATSPQRSRSSPKSRARRALRRPSSSARAGWRVDGLSVALRDPGTLARHGGGPRGVRRRARSAIPRTARRRRSRA